jgi:hypothetical protein
MFEIGTRVPKISNKTEVSSSNSAIKPKEVDFKVIQRSPSMEEFHAV